MSQKRRRSGVNGGIHSVTLAFPKLRHKNHKLRAILAYHSDSLSHKIKNKNND